MSASPTMPDRATAQYAETPRHRSKGEREMFNAISLHRRRLLGTAALTLAASQLARLAPAAAQSSTVKSVTLPPITPGAHTTFAALKQLDAGLLSVGYAEAGPATGQPVLLLHGWPYDIHSFVD